LDKTEKGTTRETNKNLNEISIKNLRKWKIVKRDLSIIHTPLKLRFKIQ
jgi:hypothetical protein